MSGKPTALDLFCGAGGATRGLQQAGFHVTGVDNRPQPRYVGDAFIQGDALNPPFALASFSLIWASPPCQRFTPHAQQAGTDTAHPDHIAAVRALLASHQVTVIENVPRAPLRVSLVLTGCMFNLNTYRKRHFETSFAILALPHGKPFGPKTRQGSVTVTGHSGGSSSRDGWTNGAQTQWQAAMDIDWMLNREIVEAIPPAYAEFIGKAALAHLR